MIPKFAQSELRNRGEDYLPERSFARNAQRTAERLPRSHRRGCPAGGLSCNCEKDCRPPLLKWRFAYMTGCVEIYTDVNYHGECDQSQENYWTAKFVLYICFLIYFVSVSRHNILPNRVIYFGENF